MSKMNNYKFDDVSFELLSLMYHSAAEQPFKIKINNKIFLADKYFGLPCLSFVLTFFCKDICFSFYFCDDGSVLRETAEWIKSANK